MSKIIPEIDEIVNFYSPETIEQIARETGFVQRESKFGGTEFLGIMTAGLFAAPDASLAQMAAMAKDINPETEISGPGIHQRIDETGVEFLKKLLAKALEMSARGVPGEIDDSIPDLLKAFERVCLIDSTHIPLPASLASIWRGSGGDGSAAEMKLQLMLDYKSGEYENVAPTDGVTPDQAYIKEVVKQLESGDLVIYDLGYSNKEAMFQIDALGAYFLCRLNHQLGLYKEDEDGRLVKFDLVKELKKREAITGVFEFHVWLMNGKSRLKIRLIAEKAPDDVANERRRKVKQKAKKRKRKYAPSGKYLYLLGWGLYITNASEDSLPASAVSHVYGIRWQIELVFKAWKSYHGLTELKGKRPERIECFIYGRLIMMVLIAFLSGSIRRYLWRTSRRELSILRTVRHFKLKAYKALSLIANPAAFTEFLIEEFSNACRLCRMESRKRPSTARKIRMLDHAFALT